MERRSAIQLMDLVVLAGLGSMAYNVKFPYVGTIHPFALVGASIP